MPPKQADVRDPRHKAFDVFRLQLSGPAEIAVSFERREVHRRAESFQEAGQKRELLLVAYLPSLHVGRAGVATRELRESAVLTIVAIVGARTNGAGVDPAYDEILDRLVEPPDRDAADGFEVVLERRVPVLRGLWQQ